MKIKYRTWFKGVPPRPIKLEVPGWAGEKTYDQGQPWHCKPFVDGATYGLELIYPFDTKVCVTNVNGNLDFECDSKDEWKDSGVDFPFAKFAPNHYGFTSSLDLKTEDGKGVMVLPHSRYFCDMTGTVPLPSIGLIESDWWPKIFFIAFRAPFEGHKSVFEKGQGIAQFIIVPKKPEYSIEQMTEAEAKSRSDMESILSKHGEKIATKKWTDTNGHAFDNKYKVLSNLGKTQHILQSLLSAQKRYEDNVKSQETTARHKMPREVFLPKGKNGNLPTNE